MPARLAPCFPAPSRCSRCGATPASCISVRSCSCFSPAPQTSPPAPGCCSPTFPSPIGWRWGCPGSRGTCGSIRFPASSCCCSARWWSPSRFMVPATRASSRAASRRSRCRPLGVFTALFVLGMQMLLLADDALMFMIFWELMSVSGYMLVVYQHQHAANRHAAFLYLLLAHVGALVILLSFGVLAAFGGGLSFEPDALGEPHAAVGHARVRLRVRRLRHQGGHRAAARLAARRAPGRALATSPR